MDRHINEDIEAIGLKLKERLD